MREGFMAITIGLAVLCLSTSTAQGAWGDMDNDPNGGYTWFDNSDLSDPFITNNPLLGGPIPPTFWEFTDISTTGTRWTGFSDDSTTSFSPNFNVNFRFYGTSLAAVNINSNGQLTMAGPSSDYSPDPIPESRTPNRYAAILWDDLAPGTAGNVYTQARIPNPWVPGRFIARIQWSNVEQYGGGSAGTFQCELWEPYPTATTASVIVFRYRTIGTPNNWPGTGEITVGIENSAGDDGVAYINYQRSYPPSGRTVVYFAPGGARPVVSGPFCVNGAENPTGAAQPVVFSCAYTDTDGHRAMRWQVEVSTDSNFDPAFTVWNNGTTGNAFSPYVASGSRADMPFGGPPLMPGVTYYWRVRIRDESGSLSQWSTGTNTFTVAQRRSPGRERRCLIQLQAPSRTACATAFLLAIIVLTSIAVPIHLRQRLHLQQRHKKR